MARQKDRRAFIAVHDEVVDHPKVEGLSDAAFRHLMRLWGRSHKDNMDGYVTDALARSKGPKVLKELTTPAYPGAEPLLEPKGEGLWYCHDYLEHQWSAAEREEMAERSRENGRKGGRPRKT